VTRPEETSTGAGERNAPGEAEHDQDSDPPRTAVPPDSEHTAAQRPAGTEPSHDQDSEPPRTAVRP